MSKILSLSLILFIFLNENFAQQDFQLYIHLGNYSDPIYSQFNKIAHLGFLHASKTDATNADVYLMGFETREKAEESLANLKRLGYTKAAMAGKDLSKGKLLFYVQLGSIEINKQVNWLKFESIPTLLALPQSGVLKILTGPFQSANDAKLALDVLKTKGFSDAFSKEVNELAPYSIGKFESNQMRQNEKLNNNLLTLKGESTPPNARIVAHPKVGPPAFWPPTSMNLDLGATPNIVSTLKRNSVLSLQKILKSENYYAGQLTGYYNDATQVAYENALKNSSEMKPFTSKTEAKANTSIDMDRLSSIISHLYEVKEPLNAINKFSDPLAKAYAAYLTFLQNGPGKEVDSKMNAAIKGAFSGLTTSKSNMPFFDFKAIYSYPNLEQIILHLFYIHSAPDNNISTPCWLFNAHHNETQSALKRYQDAKVKNANIYGCDYIMDWKDISLLNNIMVYLGGKQPDPLALSQAAEERSFFYESGQPLDAQASKSVQLWEVQIWEKLELWGKKDPINIRMLTALKIAYFQSFIRIEDHFLNKGMASMDARNMAIAVMATVMTPNLDRFM
jgi:hypothetical protein